MICWGLPIVHLSHPGPKLTQFDPGTCIDFRHVVVPLQVLQDRARHLRGSESFHHRTRIGTGTEKKEKI